MNETEMGSNFLFDIIEDDLATGCCMVGSDELIDDHFVFDKCNFMATDTTDGQHINGVHPALWLKNL